MICTTTHRPALVSLVVGTLSLLTLGCGGAGMGKALRSDVVSQMKTVEAPIAQCYEEALKRSRRLKGSMVLSFKIEPDTGVFKDTKVTQSDLTDDGLNRCVIKEVSSLKLTKPQKTVVGVDTYPIHFSPVD